MISLTTAKLLLFVALCLGPKYGDSNHAIQITDRGTYVVWTENPTGWTITQKNFASHDWPVNGTSLSTAELNQLGKDDAQIMNAIAHHDWAHDSTLYFENGDVAEKQGNKVFYTINAGSPNEQIFTIITLENRKSL